MNIAPFERLLDYVRFTSAAAVAFWGGAMLLASAGVPAGGLSAGGVSLEYASVAVIGALLFAGAVGILQERAYGFVFLAVAWTAIAVYQLDGPANLLLIRGGIASFLG